MDLARRFFRSGRGSSSNPNLLQNDLKIGEWRSTNPSADLVSFDASRNVLKNIEIST